MTITKGQALEGVSLLTRQETADFFGIHPKTLSRWVATGVIRETVLGRRIYFTVDSIREALDARN